MELWGDERGDERWMNRFFVANLEVRKRADSQARGPFCMVYAVLRKQTLGLLVFP